MITVVIPSIPSREALLARALVSVDEQTLPPEAVIVEVDQIRGGAAVTRQRGLEKVTTPWVAFLDDDDEFKPHHLSTLFNAAVENDADYVYAWYDVIGGSDPMPGHFGRPWSNDDPRQTTITVLVKTDLAQSIGFHSDLVPDPNGGDRLVSGEDYRFTLGCMEAGAKIIHVPERTWNWFHWGGNLSGMPPPL